MAASRSRGNEVLNAVADVPTALLSIPQAGWGDANPRIVEWISLTWPGNAEPFFARGLPAMVAPHALHEPDCPWGNRSRTAAILASAADKQDFRRVAIDALIDGIGDGRVSPRTLGETLARVAVSMASKCADLKPLSQRFAKLASRHVLGKLMFKEPIEKVAASKTFKLNRLCPAFSEVSRISPYHAWVIAGTLETLLESYASPPDDVHHLLSLLLELMTQLGRAPSDEARAKLATIQGGGKTALLAKSLAALESQPTRAAAEARVICAEKRLERAARWSNSQNASATTVRQKGKVGSDRFGMLSVAAPDR
jgi:hypothetical protein